MGNPVTGINGNLVQGIEQAAGQQSQTRTGNRSFESVMRQNAAEGQLNALAAQPAQVSGAELEHMRLDLMQRLDRISADGNRTSALLPELIDTRTRLGLLKEAMANAGPANGVDLHGRFSQVESEWYAVEGIMKSNKNLSQGELLGLQARLYQVSQHIEVMSKVVDQMTSGVKTILNTNV